jgi:hypothetical protein
VRSCVVFGPDGVALDQGPTRCWHRMPSGHARAPLLTTTTGLATLATVAASPAACSPLRRVGRGALAGPTSAWQYDHAQLSSSGRRGSRVDRRVGADAGRGCGDDRARVSLRRCWPSSGCEDFLYTIKAGLRAGPPWTAIRGTATPLQSRHGITPEACAPLARARPTRRQRRRCDSPRRDSPSGQLRLPNLRRLGCNLRPGAPRHLAPKDRRLIALPRLLREGCQRGRWSPRTSPTLWSGVPSR